MKLRNLLLIIPILFLSCSENDIVDEKKIREELELGANTFSISEIKKIKENTKPIYFENIEDAKNFLNISLKGFEGSNKSLISNSGTKDTDRSFRNSNEPCGIGFVNLQTSNMSMYLHLNVSFDYNKDKVSNIKSNLSGFTLGMGFTQLSAIHNVDGDRIDVIVSGTLNYNIVVEGIGTVFKENVILKGSYDPCTGSGGIDYCPPSKCAERYISVR
ncbi:hypothetical protein [Tenacibaculum ovolyticum]|uniref:hypothetical protein n=1 Tax=Tenacibaculum ovolyticum TaxID=104270 RepID=UPI001F1FE4D4|nr:hypothetical protein [Tenacibaculum ovolyticum]